MALLTVSPLLVLAKDAPLELTKKLNQFKTFSADFNQVVEDSVGKVVQKSVGVIHIKKPGLFRWETTDPIQQLIIANPEILWVYDHKLEQATRYNTKQTFGKTPALLLAGNEENLSAFTIKHQPTTQELDWFSIEPRDLSGKKEDTFQRMLLGFQGQRLHKMVIADTLGQTIFLFFRNAHLNAPLSERLFQFTAPPGTDVIDNTQSE